LSAKDSLVTRSPAVDRSAVTRAVTAAGGRFAPGHPGEQVPFEMVGAVLEETCRAQRRVRVCRPASSSACCWPGACSPNPMLRLPALVSGGTRTVIDPTAALRSAP
jgi:hypothetical protein